MIKAVLFDLDDTLYEEMQFVRGGFKAVARYMSEHHGIDEHEFNLRLLAILEEQGRGQVFDTSLKELSLFNKTLVNKLIQQYRYHKPTLTLYPDAESALSQLRASFKLGLITDGNLRVQGNKIRVLGLCKFLDVIIKTNCYGVKNQKPAVFPYERALNKLKTKPSEVVFVGDNPSKDFVGAKKLCIQTVRLLRGPYRNKRVERDFEADWSISSFNELKTLIEKL